MTNLRETATRCTQWAIGLFLVGTLVTVFGTDLYVALAERAGVGAAAGLRVIDTVITFIRIAAVTQASALVAAAVILRALAPRWDTSDRSAAAP